MVAGKVRDRAAGAAQEREVGPASGAALLVSLVAAGYRSRADLLKESGLARTTVSMHLGVLFGKGVLLEGVETFPSAGGRPAKALQINPGFAVVLAADIGESRARLAVMTLRTEILAESTIEVALQEDPGLTLSALANVFDRLLVGIGKPGHPVLGIGLSLPAPIDFDGGRVVGPSIMPKWDGFAIRGWFRDNYDLPVEIENDVNLLTLFEHRHHWPDVSQLLFLKAGRGIGSGIIADGHLYRGAQGAAGDIGHIQTDPLGGPPCRCGKTGCLEAVAAGWALIRDLASHAVPPVTVRDVLALAGSGDRQAAGAIRSAGIAIGEVSAGVVSVLNPSVIVVGGSLAGAGEALLSGIRDMIHRRSLPLATRELTIALSSGNADAGIKGAAQLVIERQLGRSRVDATLTRLSAAADKIVLNSTTGSPVAGRACLQRA